MNYEAVIGLEIHSELKTNTKIFCGCATKFGAEQNTHVCPVCLGLPGVLPVLNKRVVEFAIKAGLALNCTINKYSKFDRKNYYYPDLPKNFQTSQYDLPIAEHGYVDIETENGTKRIRILRIHMEEDAGKLVHSGATITDSLTSNVDYNRTGVPLIEIVSEPDMSTPEEARVYMEKIKSILEYIDVSNCRMEEGNLRADLNISLRPAGEKTLGTKAEMKNINSFKAVEDALSYEIERQEEILDLVPIVTTEEEIEAYRKGLPELPDARRERYMKEFGLSAYDAGIITASRAMAEYFEACLAGGADAKSAANWIMGDLAKNLNAEGKTIEESPVEASRLAQMLALIEKGTISSKIAKKVFAEMWTSSDVPEKIVEDKGLVQITDTKAIEAIVDAVIAANPKPVADYKSGNKKALGALVGQVMKQSKGKANPQMVNQLLADKLSQ